MSKDTRGCTGRNATRRKDVALPVLGEVSGPGGGGGGGSGGAGGGRLKARKSRTSRWRAGVLITVHVLFLAHLTHWLTKGETVSPVEPSESMHTLELGELNAGFVFFGVALLATLIVGRMFCGWGCHIVALQDLCGWLMKKTGHHPRAFRSRLLVFVPLTIALYMFVWPTFKRDLLLPALDVVWPQAMAALAPVPAFPGFTNHLARAGFWDTFAGPLVAIPFLLVCGFATVYFLGAKGYCTYACPYGGFFAPAQQVAPGRIMADLSRCEGCGHCTAVCTSNVRVHEEIQIHGGVVDPGCMKCMDCVSVCPNEALSFRFAAPPALSQKGPASKRRGFTRLVISGVIAALCAALAWATPVPWMWVPPAIVAGLAAAVAVSGALEMTRSRRPRGSDPVGTPPKGAGPKPDLSWPEEIALALVFLVAFLSVRGVYGVIPMLFALGVAACAVFVVWKVWRMVRERNVRIIGAQLKQHGRMRPAGAAFLAFAALFAAFVAHCGAVRVIRARADAWERRASVAREVVFAGAFGTIPAEIQEAAERGLEALRLGGPISRGGIALGPHGGDDLRMAWLHLVLGETAEAEESLRRALSLQPAVDGLTADMVRVIALQPGRGAEAIEFGEATLREHPDFNETRFAMAQQHMAMGAPDDAVRLFERAAEERPGDAEALARLTSVLLEIGRAEDALAKAEEAAGLAPDDAEIRNNLAVALISAGKYEDAAREMDRAAELAGAHGAPYLERAAQIQMEMGRRVEAERRMTEARRLLEEVAAERPFDPTPRARLGAMLMGISAPKAAAEQYAKAVRLAPHNAALKREFAAALFGSGRVDEAVRVLRRAAAVDPLNEAAYERQIEAIRRGG